MVASVVSAKWPTRYGASMASGPEAQATGAAGEAANGAAFFDLDRTLLKGSSGRIIGEQMKEAGLVSRNVAPIERVIFGVFDLVGETWPTMLLTRQGARAAKGWSRERVAAVAQAVAPELVASIQPYAMKLIREHRAAGRPVVIATTTPYDLLRPMADLLGVDALIATHYGESGGTYDGTISGHFVWGRGKRNAVVEWADEHGIDLEESYAYSDSYYDIPLFNAVGHPNAVNPDPRLNVVATGRRWPILHFDVPPGVPKIAGIEPQRLAMLLGRPELLPGIRFHFDGVDRIPLDGPAILVANHRSYFDPLAIGMLLSRRGRPVRFLGKKEVFDAPLIGDVATAMGGIRVDRGTGSDEPLQAAEDALAHGEAVALMPQGTIPRGVAFFDPVLKGRWGAAKLAMASRAPVIPIGLWGTEKVWPRSERVPNLLSLTDPVHVHVTVGEPVELKYRSVDADTRRIMEAITALLPESLRTPYTPTEQELRRTYPSGWQPHEATDEAQRRPGED